MEEDSGSERASSAVCLGRASWDVAWDTERHVHADREEEENMGGSG